MTESAPSLEQAEGTAEQGSSTESLPAETPVGPEGVIDESEAIGTPADGPGGELLAEGTYGETDGEGDYDGIVVREVTDENPLVEGETPEGLTRTEIEGDPVPTDVGTPLPSPIYSDEEPTDEEVAAALAAQNEQDPEEEFEPHELDLPPTPEVEDKPASHAPFDPTEGHR